MIYCKKCHEYYSFENSLLAIKKINLNIIEIYADDIVNNYNNKLSIFYSNIISDILQGEEVNFEEINLEINNCIKYICSNCNEQNTYMYSYSMRYNFYRYAMDYISIELNQQFICNFNVGINEIGFDVIANLDSVLNVLPKKYLKNKCGLIKLHRDVKTLNQGGEKGGDSEIINWIIEQLSQNIFTLIFTSTIFSLKFIINKIFKRFVISNKIKKKILYNHVYWNDVSFDDLVKYLNVPPSYKGSKEELVLRIIEEKTNFYKQLLIDKNRKKT